jgi:hypothetical protein
VIYYVDSGIVNDSATFALYRWHDEYSTIEALLLRPRGLSDVWEEVH